MDINDNVLEFQRIQSRARARARAEAEAEALAAAQAAQAEAEAAADDRVIGMPSWAARELTTEFVEDEQKSPGVDKPFLIITLILLVIGLIMLMSASFSASTYMMGRPLALFRNQVMFAIIGICAMILISRFSVNFFSRWSTVVLLFSVGLLVLVLISGTRINGATRWLGFGSPDSAFSLQFQPSEIAKIAVVLSFAQMSCKFGPKRMRTFKYGVLPFAVITAVIGGLLWMQPHVSALIIIAMIAVVMMFMGGTQLRYFVVPFVAGILVLGLMMVPSLLSSVREGGMQGGVDAIAQEAENSGIDFASLGHWGVRIDTWLNPGANPLGTGFQTNQSLNAVGSGGWLGQGLGQSRQKHLLPEEHNDFIFAIIAEELGFVGAMLILSLFALLIIRGYWLAMHVDNRFGSLLVIGITTLLAIHVFLNVAVAIGMFPPTGIALPLFSYGGTALVMQLAQIGIILSVSREIPVEKHERRGREEYEKVENPI